MVWSAEKDQIRLLSKYDSDDINSDSRNAVSDNINTDSDTNANTETNTNTDVNADTNDDYNNDDESNNNNMSNINNTPGCIYVAGNHGEIYR